MNPWKSKKALLGREHGLGRPLIIVLNGSVKKSGRWSSICVLPQEMIAGR